MSSIALSIFFMMTSSNGNFSASLWPGGVPSQRPVALRFDIFVGLCLNKRLSKQSRRRWSETSLRSLWRHCDVMDLRLSMESSWVQVIYIKQWFYHQISNISRILVGNKFVDQSDVVGDCRAAPTTSSFWTKTWLQCTAQRQLQDETRTI